MLRPDFRTADKLHQVAVKVNENDDERRCVPNGRLHFLFNSTKKQEKSLGKTLWSDV